MGGRFSAGRIIARRSLAGLAKARKAENHALTLRGAAILLGLAALMTAGAAAAQNDDDFSDVIRGRVIHTGEIVVLGVDTLRIGALTIRLAGITGPDENDVCFNASPDQRDCGLAALEQTLRLVRQADGLTCRLEGLQQTAGLDRLLATCRSDKFAPDELKEPTTDLAEILVRLGVARAAPNSAKIGFFRLAESAAREAGRGFWNCDAPTPPGWRTSKSTLCGGPVGNLGIDLSSVSAVQRSLNELGYDAGPEDGLIGPTTRRAIANFQRDKGLAVTGRISKDLLEQLANAQSTRR